MDRIVLVGMMGSGKSAVGQALAERTGWRFADNDELLEAATGRTARDIAADGEPALRSAEAAALRAGLELPPPTIVAAAAGTVLDPELRRELADAGFVVWLRPPTDVLESRAAGAAHGDAGSAPGTHVDRRRRRRAGVALRGRRGAEVDTADSSRAEVAETVLAALSERGPTHPAQRNPATARERGSTGGRLGRIQCPPAAASPGMDVGRSRPYVM